MPPYVAIVKTSPGASCMFRLRLVLQVDSGIMSTSKAEGDLSSSEAFEFLSATFGATLPRGHIAVVPSVPEDACSPLSETLVASINGSGAVGGAAVLVKRGGCSFGAKAKHVQVRHLKIWERNPASSSV